MFVTKMCKKIKSIYRFFTRCHIFIGKPPASVCAPAIILFPVLPFQINCGFAGLMTLIDKQSDVGEFDTDEELERLWKGIKSKNLIKILGEEITVDNYLHGFKALESLEEKSLELKSENAQQIIFFQPTKKKKLFVIAGDVKSFLMREESLLENNAAKFSSTDLETVNSQIVLLKDIQWLLEKDILDNFDKIIYLSRTNKSKAFNASAFKKYRKINLVLNAIDRLEVRGRDSAGLQINIFLQKEEIMEQIITVLKKNNLYDDYLDRSKHGDLINSSICVTSGISSDNEKEFHVSFTYKTFSIVGELGRNVSNLRQMIKNDRILWEFAQHEVLFETAVAHTRWASVGSITQENCHPVNNYKISNAKNMSPLYKQYESRINVVLNGDIDNYLQLRSELEKDGEIICPEVTTDTKIIPLQVEKYLLAGHDPAEAFRMAVNDFEGSHAIMMTSNLKPGNIFLALKGSGQAIYVGISSDQYMVSSELYGIVEVMPFFVQMNGEEVIHGKNKTTGQIFILDQSSPSTLEGVKACHYDGTQISLKQSDVKKAQITTRDIHRGDYKHYFLKEVSQAGDSVKRTLRGKYIISQKNKSSWQVTFNLGDDIVPNNIRLSLANGTVKNIILIGHGTAAVAGDAVANILETYLRDTNIRVTARVASEMSGFLLKEDLSDTLVIPITQSGTTTDTNRAVAMSRERGAHIISIVNRRQSDITVKSHGVFYTSDGRDIEMSVASTKAFYSQIIAGQILALFFAQIMKTRNDDFIASELQKLENTPQLMEQVLQQRKEIAESVGKTISKKFWAVVGSGPNKAAAEEIRIKLSELCYRTISADIVENKKHIDLSAEPLILVCAAGNPEPVIEDIAKDVNIFKAHNAAVVVFAQKGDKRFDKVADAVIEIPDTSGTLSVILNTLAGHLWGYYAACAIDKEAHVFREFRDRLNFIIAEQTKSDYSLYKRIDDVHLRHLLDDFYYNFNRHSNEGAFNLLGVKIISDLVLLLKYAAGKLPLEDFRNEFRNEENIISPLDLLDATVGRAIDELTRPIDAIRHQAKTVTVGTSRREKELKGIVFDLLENLNYSAKNLTYRNIMMINRIQPAIATVRGYTDYNISSLDEKGNPAENTMIVVGVKGGEATDMKSRADNPTALIGVKRTIVSTGHVYLGKGKTDGAPILIVPLLGEVKGISKLLLIHIIFNESLNLTGKIEVLGYKYNDIRNLINEYNLTWHDRYLENISLESLFSEPVEVIAGRIKLQFG